MAFWAPWTKASFAFHLPLWCTTLAVTRALSFRGCFQRRLMCTTIVVHVEQNIALIKNNIVGLLRTPDLHGAPKCMTTPDKDRLLARQTHVYYGIANPPLPSSSSSAALIHKARIFAPVTVGAFSGSLCSAPVTVGARQ